MLLTQKHKEAIREKFKVQIQKGIESEMYNQIIRERSNELFRVEKDGVVQPNGAELLKNAKIQKHLNKAKASFSHAQQQENLNSIDNYLMQDNNP